MSEMISFGGGVNSVAMTILLVNEGWRGPIVFADTGGEHPETYCYMEYFGKWLEKRGMGITHLEPGSECHNGRAIVTLENYCRLAGLVPFMAARWCSREWKRGPLERWRKKIAHEVTLIGFCADEPRRFRDDPAVRYPLENVTRGECARIIRAEGLEVPPKSSCFFCPMQSNAEWKRLAFEHPDLYERAAQLERNATEKRGKWITLDASEVSLDQMRERRWEGQAEMDLSEWLPCLCAL
jgi:3'-phosphoadenosine 5'-phosphosulfate sulfotransferase (PAPS reductase)/FAD synthetase